MTVMQRAVSLIYPDQCMTCSELVDSRGGLCGPCWGETQFASGLTCTQCATPLPGIGDGSAEFCDDCLQAPRPWSQGRAAIYYTGAGRRLVLSFKYGDRTDIAATVSQWMERAAAEILTPDTLIVPVPAHWARLLRRRYNPAVELAKALGRRTGLQVVHNGLIRLRATKTQEGLGFEARFRNLEGAIGVNSRYKGEFAGRHVCIIDDTLTSGATLTAASDSLLSIGVKGVSVLVLARALKNA